MMAESTRTAVSTKEERSERSEPAPPCPRHVRFSASLTSLVCLGLAQCLIVRLLPFIGLPAHIFIVLLGIFSYEWCGVHSLALTRTRRAYFDVANVLETYQPRARTMGHLFQPEPPTPGNVKFAEGTATDNDASKHSEFNNARDSHYADMYAHCQKMAKEMEVMEKAAASPSLDAGQTGDLVAADPSKDKKEHEEKKKKEQDDYKKQLEKPFSC